MIVLTFCLFVYITGLKVLLKTFFGKFNFFGKFIFWKEEMRTRPGGRKGQALVYGSWFGSWFMNLGSVHGSVHGSVLDNDLLEHGGLHCVLPCAVHPDLGHPPDTQEYLGLLSEPFNTTQTF